MPTLVLCICNIFGWAVYVNEDTNMHTLHNTYIYTYTVSHISTYVHTHIHNTYIHTYIHNTYIHTPTYIIHRYTNTYIRTYIHTYTIHTYTHTYIHTWEYVDNKALFLRYLIESSLNRPSSNNQTRFSSRVNHFLSCQIMHWLQTQKVSRAFPMHENTMLTTGKGLNSCSMIAMINAFIFKDGRIKRKWVFLSRSS